MAAYAAIALSVGSVMLSMWFLAVLAGKMSSIEEDLIMDMTDFKLLEQDVWKGFNMRSMRGASVFVRKTKRQAGQCQCNSQNACPPGQVIFQNITSYFIYSF